MIDSGGHHRGVRVFNLGRQPHRAMQEDNKQ